MSRHVCATYPPAANMARKRCERRFATRRHAAAQCPDACLLELYRRARLSSPPRDGGHELRRYGVVEEASYGISSYSAAVRGASVHVCLVACLRGGGMARTQRGAACGARRLQARSKSSAFATQTVHRVVPVLYFCVQAQMPARTPPEGGRASYERHAVGRWQVYHRSRLGYGECSSTGAAPNCPSSCPSCCRPPHASVRLMPSKAEVRCASVREGRQGRA